MLESLPDEAGNCLELEEGSDTVGGETFILSDEDATSDFVFSVKVTDGPGTSTCFEGCFETFELPGSASFETAPWSKPELGAVAFAVLAAGAGAALLVTS